MLQVALITDIHFGPDRGTKMGSVAPALAAEFKRWLGASGCELLVELGDRISDVDRDTDRANLKQVASWFADIPVEQQHLAGNHDLARLSLAENETLLAFPLHSRSIDRRGFHLVFWNPGSKLDQKLGFSMLQEELGWLENDLRLTTLPTIIFTHVPLDNGSMRGNFYFEKAYPQHAHYPAAEGERIREVIERSDKVVLCVNGHAHWNAYHCIDGIHYITLPSLTETFPTFPEACRSWAKLSIDAEISLKVFGNLPIEYRLPLKFPLNRHWVNMHKDYAPRAAEPA